MISIRFVEVSHTITPGMRTYPGLPEPRVDVVLDYQSSRAHYDDRAEFYIGALHLCGNTGTYIDSPRHRYRDGMDLASLPLASLAHLPITVVHVPWTPERRIIGPDAFANAVLHGRAVLVHTGFSRHWGSERYFHQHPFLTAEACELLVEAGAGLVGIDSLNIDDIEDRSRPAHTLLLGAGIPVCEHMTNLAAAPAQGFLHAVPIAWAGGASFPVRAYIMTDATPGA